MMTEVAKKLRDKIIEVINRVEYQPGYPKWDGINILGLPKKPGAQPGVTWCNEAANAILVELGYDTMPILNKRGIGWTNANDMYDNALRASRNTEKTGVLELYIGESKYLPQYLANMGFCVLAAVRNESGGAGHVGIVCPTDDLYNKKEGPLIGQAGAVNGVRSERLSFDFPGLTPVKYFVLAKK